MPETRGRRRPWLAAAVVVVSGCGLAHSANAPGAAQPRPRVSPNAARGSTPATPQPGPSSPADQDPARYARQVIAYAGKASIDPRLLMAILYNESYKPHDPALERAWQRINPDAAFGIANMHRATFDQTKQGRDFAGRNWEDLPDDPDLAVEAAAWYLHDLAARLPSPVSGPYTQDELLALGYDAGPGNMRAFAHGATPGPTAQSYLDRLRANWAAAGRALRPHG